jgi:hypothetical protein
MAMPSATSFKPGSRVGTGKLPSMVGSGSELGHSFW